MTLCSVYIEIQRIRGNCLAAKNTLTVLFDKGAPKGSPKHTVYFDSIRSFRTFMTMQKLEALVLISWIKPKSVYELAKVLRRPLPPVQRDCEALSRYRFIKLEKRGDSRRSLAPTLAFNYDTIAIRRSEYPYVITFRDM